MSDSSPTDEELVRVIQQSDSPGALEKLLRRHLKRVRAMVFQMVLDDAAADDLTQDVFYRAIRGLPQFDGRSLFSTWLYRIVRNTTYRHLEKSRRELTIVAPQTITRAHDAQEPSARILEQELSSAIQAAIGELSPSLRSAVVLVILQGLSIAEAADIEGCAAATIYWRIHQARKLLGARLSGYLQPESHSS